MAGIRKKTWKTENGALKYCYEVSYYIDGVRCRKSGFKTKLEAQAALPTLTKSYSNNITIKELVNIYINEHCLLRCKDSTINLYNNYLKNNLNNIKLKQVSKIKIRDLEKLLIDWKHKGISDKTINDLIGFLRAVFNYGIKNKWLSENPAKEINKIPKKNHNIQFLKQEEIREFLEYIKTFPLEKEAALLTAINTGIRISELLAIEWTDIDFEKRTISINKQYYKDNLSTTKTLQSNRKVNIPQSLLNVLIELKKKKISNIVFSGKTGKYLNQNKFVKNYFKKAMQYIGKPDYSFHCLRHTFATVLLSNGISLKYVQEQLGHSSPQTTLNVYNHVLPGVNDKALRILEEWTQNGHINKRKTL